MSLLYHRKTRKVLKVIFIIVSILIALSMVFAYSFTF